MKIAELTKQSPEPEEIDIVGRLVKISDTAMRWAGTAGNSPDDAARLVLAAIRALTNAGDLMIAAQCIADEDEGDEDED